MSDVEPAGGMSFPSAEQLKTPGMEMGFATQEQTPAQRRAARSAATTVRNLEQRFAQVGHEEEAQAEVEAAMEPGWFESLTRPVSDLFGVSLYPVTGFVGTVLDEEGNFRADHIDEAFRQMRIEFDNALPFREREEALRLSFSDILQRYPLFKDSTAGRWAAMGLGLVMDVSLDPLTSPFMGLKAGKLAFGAPKWMGGAGMPEPLMNVPFRKAIGPHWKRMGGTARLLHEASEKGIPGAAAFGRKFQKTFELEQVWMRAPKERQAEVREGIARQIRRRDEMLDNYNRGVIDLEKVVRSLGAELSVEERRLFQAFMDQPDELFEEAVDGYLRQIGETGTIAPGQSKDHLKFKANQFRDLYRAWAGGYWKKEVKKGAARDPDDWVDLREMGTDGPMRVRHTIDDEVEVFFDSEVGLGLLDPDKLLFRYVPARLPQTPGSKRLWRHLQERNGFQKKVAAEEIPTGTFMPGLPDVPLQAYQQPRSFVNIIDRIAAGHPTELDIVSSTIARGMEHVKSTTTQRFIDSTLKDTTLVKAIDPNDVSTLLKDPTFVRTLDEMGYVPVNLEKLASAEVKEFAKSNTERFGIEDFIKKAEVDVDPTNIFVMPRALVEDLGQTRKMLDPDTESGRLFDGFRKAQGIWKSYALLTPGYGLRNMYSNWWQNWLAGVTDPTHYAAALAVQSKGTQNLPFVVREIVEDMLGGAKGIDDVILTTDGGRDITIRELGDIAASRSITNTGMFARDMNIGLEEDLFGRIDDALVRGMVESQTPMTVAMRDMAKKAGLPEDQAGVLAQLWDTNMQVGAHHSHMSLEAFQRQRLSGVAAYKSLDEFDQAEGVLYQREGENFVLPVWGMPKMIHGESIELPMARIFADSPKPDMYAFRGIPGAEDIGVDFKKFTQDVRDSLDLQAGEVAALKSMEEWATSVVGPQNMTEFGAIYTHMADAMPLDEAAAATFRVMRAAREDLDSKAAFNAAVKEFDTTKEGGPKVVSMKLRGSADKIDWYEAIYNTDINRWSRPGEFSLWNDQDRLIGRNFGWSGAVVGEDQARAASYMIARAADELGRSTQDIQAALWSWQRNKASVEALLLGDVVQSTAAKEAGRLQATLGYDIGPMPNFTATSAYARTAKPMMEEWADGEWRRVISLGTQPKTGQDYLNAGWPIRYLSESEMAGAWGQVDHGTHEILMRRGLSDDQLQHTLHHEVLHANTETQIPRGKELAIRAKALEELGDEGFKDLWDYYRGRYSDTTQEGLGEFIDDWIHPKRDLVESALRDGRWDRLGFPAKEGIDARRVMRSSDAEVKALRHAAEKNKQKATGGFYRPRQLPQEFHSDYEAAHRVNEGIRVTEGGYAIRGLGELGDVRADDIGVLRAFHEDLSRELITEHNGQQKLKWMIPLEEELGFTHHIRADMSGTSHGLEPDYTLVLDMVPNGAAAKHDLAAGIGAIFADGMRQAQMSVLRPVKSPTPTSRIQIQVSRFDGGPFQKREIEEFSRSGFAFRLEPGGRSVRFLGDVGATQDEVAVGVRQLAEKLVHNTWLQGWKNFFSNGTYHHVDGGVYDERRYGEAIAALRLAISGGRAEASDLARGIFNNLHEPYRKVYAKHSALNNWPGFPNAGEGEAGISKALQALEMPGEAPFQIEAHSGAKKLEAAVRATATGKGDPLLSMLRREHLLFPDGYAVELTDEVKKMVAGAGEGSLTHELRKFTYGTGAVHVLQKDLHRARSNWKTDVTIRSTLTPEQKDALYLNLTQRGDQLWQDVIQPGIKIGTAARYTDPQTYHTVTNVQHLEGLLDIGMLRQTTGRSSRGLPSGAVKGAVKQMEDRSHHIGILEGGDFTTFIHETAHVWRKDLAYFADAREAIERWMKKPMDKWGEKEEERFARAFERYVMEGPEGRKKLPDFMVKPMAQAQQYMAATYQTARQSPINVNINEEVRTVFDQLLGRDTLNITMEQKSLLDDIMSAGVSRETAEDYIQDAGAFLQRTVGQQGPLQRLNRRFNTGIENNARLAHLMGKLKKGKASAGGNSLAMQEEVAARDSVMKYLFDYSHGLTDFESEVMRSLIPFYSWMRFNIPLQVQALFEDPARYSRFFKLMNGIEGHTREWQDIPTPDYYDELHAVRMPMIMNAKPVYINPNLPFQDLNRINLKSFYTGLSPFIRGPLGEWVPEKGYSFFTERAIERYPGEPSEVMPFMSKKTENIIGTMMPTAGKIMRYAEKRKRGEGKTQLVSELLGVKLMNVDAERTLQGQTYAKRAVLQNYKKRLEAEEGIKLPPAATAPPKSGRRGRRRRRRRQRRGRGEN